MSLWESGHSLAFLLCLDHEDWTLSRTGANATGRSDMRLLSLIPALLVFASLMAPAGPASAQSKENLRKLAEIYKLIQNDETGKAVEQLNTMLDESPEDADTASKAMLLRGQAYAKAGRHAQALSDYNAALWLKGLNDSQRKDAVAGRQAALAKLGLADESEDPPANEDASSTQTASIPTTIPTSSDDEEPASETVSAPAPEPDPAPANEPASGAWQTAVQTDETEAEDEDAIGAFFNNLFGGSGNEPAAETGQQTETAATSGWTASTSETSASPSASSEDGRQYRVQLASVGTREGADSEVRRLSRLLGDALQGESPSVVRMDTDSGNTYFRIVVGPKPSRRAANSMCQDFKSRGVDCLVVSSR